MANPSRATVGSIRLTAAALHDAQDHLATMPLGSMLQLGGALGDGPYIEGYLLIYRDRLARLLDDALDGRDPHAA